MFHGISPGVLSCQSGWCVIWNYMYQILIMFSGCAASLEPLQGRLVAALSTACPEIKGLLPSKQSLYNKILSVENM